MRRIFPPVLDIKRYQSLWTLFIVSSFVIAAMPSFAESNKIDCVQNRCGLHSNGPYQNYVIGKLMYVGSDADMAVVYRWAKSHEYWGLLPDRIEPYLRDIKVVVIAVPSTVSRRPLTVFMQEEEYKSGPYVVGDLVRYSPHGDDHEVPQGNADDLALYHGLTGCVATLCRQSDRACFARYQQGVFTKKTGQQVNVQTGHLVAHGLRIDPVSLLPLQTK